MQVDAPGAAPVGVGLLPGQAGRARVGPSEAVGPGESRDVRTHPRVDPGLGLEHVLRVDGEPRPQLEPGGRARPAKVVQVGPRSLGVDVVGSEGADPAPVVHAGAEQVGKIIEVGQVGRHLHPGRRPESEAGGSDGGKVGLAVRVGLSGHRGARLGPKVLDDHLLEVTMATADGADGVDGLCGLVGCLADAHEQACRERDGMPSGVFEHSEAHLGVLVR